MLRAARRWTLEGARVTGLVEVFDDEAASARHAVRLKNLRTGNEYQLFQDLGPLAAACHLDGAGIVSACASLRAEIASGCDLVVSKFGQLESLRSGLNHAFAAAVEQDTPILTAVSPTYRRPGQRFPPRSRVGFPPRRAPSIGGGRVSVPIGTGPMGRSTTLVPACARQNRCTHKGTSNGYCNPPCRVGLGQSPIEGDWPGPPFPTAWPCCRPVINPPSEPRETALCRSSCH